MDPYATHIPVTAMALHRALTDFPELPILECGCGDYSSLMIWMMKGNTKHVIYSADPAWAVKYRGIAEVHHVELAEPKRWQDVDVGHGWGLCLMDSEESVVNRATRIPGLLERCKVVVMHDARRNVVPSAEYFRIFTGLEPWTWIGSNEINIGEWFGGVDE